MDDPEAFFDTYAQERDANLSFGADIPLLSHTQRYYTQSIRDTLRDMKGVVELDLFCKTMKDLVSGAEYQGFSRDPVMELIGSASEILHSSVDRDSFAPEERDRVKGELIRACWLFDKDKAFPETLAADFDKELKSRRHRIEPAVKFETDLSQARDVFDLGEILGFVREYPFATGGFS